MKIPPSRLESFMASPKSSILQYSGLLLYGEDVGVVFDRERKMIDDLDLYEKHSFSFEGGSDSSEVLTSIKNEYLTGSFFGEKKLILIYDVKGLQASQLQAVLKSLVSDEDKSENLILCVCRENLEPKNAIRKLFESHEFLVSIPCYHDNKNALEAVAREFAVKNNLSFAPKVLGMFADMMEKNRGEMLSELDKLVVYKTNDDNRSVTFDDLESLITEGRNSNIFDLVDLFFLLDVVVFEEVLCKILRQKLEGMSAVVSGIINYTLKLLGYVQSMKYQNKSIDDVVADNKIFFKRVSILQKHISIWNENNLCKLASKLSELEYSSRVLPEVASSSLLNLIYMLSYKIKR